MNSESLTGQHTNIILVKTTCNKYKYFNENEIGITFIQCLSNYKYYDKNYLMDYNIRKDYVTGYYYHRSDMANGFVDGSNEIRSFRVTGDCIRYNGHIYYNRRTLNRHGFDVCQNCGNVFSLSHYCNCRERELCFNYHSQTRLNKGGRARFRLGIEIEKEDNEMREKENAHDLRDRSGWIKETDSSLDENGFELISPILNFRNVQSYIDKIADYIGADYSENCGGHIHISDRKRNPSLLFDDVAGYFPLLYAMFPKRITRDYSRAFKKDVYKQCQGSHSQSVNINNRTLELRIFPSPKNKSVLEFRVKLVHLMLINKRSDVKDIQRDLLNTNSKLFKLLTTRYNLTTYIRLYNRFMSYTSRIEGIELTQKNLKNIEKRLREIETNKNVVTTNESEEE